MINQQDFFKKYNNQEMFYQSGLSWDILMEIEEDYDLKLENFKKIATDYVNEISKLAHVHSVRFRIKDTEHLIEKIIRKAVEYEDTDIQFSKDTYLVEITDIIGIRALYVFKSDYLPLHKAITSNYKKIFCEKPQVKLRKGDDEKIYQGLKNVEFQYGVDYRSIHYTIRYTDDDGIMVPIEIQTRSIFEEGWSEINHKLLYKKEYFDIAEEALLKKTSSVLSSLAGDCDTLGELMKSIAEREEDIDILDENVLAKGHSIIDEIIKGK